MAGTGISWEATAWAPGSFEETSWEGGAEAPPDPGSSGWVRPGKVRPIRVRGLLVWPLKVEPGKEE